MPEKKSFWSTVPGLITGIAAIITGLVALISVFAKSGNHATSSSGGTTSPAAAASSPSPGASVAPTPSVTDTSTLGQGDGGTGGNTGTVGMPTSPGGPAQLTANPASMNFGSVGLGQTSSTRTLTITNAGGSPTTITIAPPNGTNATLFSVTSSTCGNGAVLAPGQPCTVDLQATAPALGATANANLNISYQGPDSPLSVPLAATGGLG
ncbi:MAG: choice-of-anchor D domain-containing protein [Actinomycetota bacterium]